MSPSILPYIIFYITPSKERRLKLIRHGLPCLLGGWGAVSSEPKKPCTPRGSLLSPNSYLEGQGDLVSRFIRELTRVAIWVIGLINLISKSLDAPSKPYVEPRRITSIFWNAHVAQSGHCA